MAARKRIVFLCSGGGANMRFIHQACLRGWLRAELVAVVTDSNAPQMIMRKQMTFPTTALILQQVDNRSYKDC